MNIVDAQWKELLNAARGDVHLAVMTAPFLDLMLEGKKTVESRFSMNKIAPYEKIKPGDLVLLKLSSGPAMAAYTAGKVQFVELNAVKLRQLRDEYGGSIGGDSVFWEAQKTKRYATLIEVTNLQRLPCVRVSKRNMLGWVKLS